MHRRIMAPGALAAASLMLAIPASAASLSPGAPGIGDPYYPAYGNGGYDVSHYDLRLKYQPATDELEGTATLLAKTTQDLSRFNLDFLLDVSEVRVNGAKASFATSGEHELEITPNKALAKGTSITVVVRYRGVPSTKEAYGFNAWLRTSDGGVAAGEPEGAWWWFPSNDHPLDKATYDVSVQVPNGTQFISNGTLQSTSSRAGWTRYNWRSNKPQATYLATFAAGRFDVTTGTSESGIPVINAYSKDLGDRAGAARASIERTGEIADYVNASRAADDAFWSVEPGDPGPENQFHIAVYDRGALALQALRNEIGDDAFFAILKGWPQKYAYGNASVADFVRYAEEVSGKPLAALFDTWLFQPSKPGAPAARSASIAKSAVEQPKSWKKIAATNEVHEH